ncbi:MAG: hypothetical protein ACK5CT_03270, partial [Bacteroidota bacterium]
ALGTGWMRSGSIKLKTDWSTADKRRQHRLYSGLIVAKIRPPVLKARMDTRCGTSATPGKEDAMVATSPACMS